MCITYPCSKFGNLMQASSQEPGIGLRELRNSEAPRLHSLLWGFPFPPGCNVELNEVQGSYMIYCPVYLRRVDHDNPNRRTQDTATVETIYWETLLLGLMFRISAGEGCSPLQPITFASCQATKAHSSPNWVSCISIAYLIYYLNPKP